MAYEALKKLATDEGGACVYEFSQAQAFKVRESRKWFSKKHAAGEWEDQGKLYKMVLRGQGNQKMEMGGICATLCAFWIGFHATQGSNNPFTRDRSVWDYLYNDGGLNLGAATNIVVEHHQSSGNQLAYFTKLLAKFKVHPRLKRAGGAAINHTYQPFNALTTAAVAREITENYGYKYIELSKTIAGTGPGHAVSAFCDGPDVLFMDPNIGEFWFPNKAGFTEWLNFFWITTYGANNNYKSMRVHDFVHRA